MRLRGDISFQQFFNSSDLTEEARSAYGHARQATLGEVATTEVDSWIRSVIEGKDRWVLIGGPPCQAYSLAGRSRMRGADPKAFEEDKRHFLYREYLRIIRDFGPAVFVMENVKGILSSTHGGSRIFDQIIDDHIDGGKRSLDGLGNGVGPGGRSRFVEIIDDLQGAVDAAHPRAAGLALIFNHRCLVGKSLR